MTSIYHSDDVTTSSVSRMSPVWKNDARARRANDTITKPSPASCVCTRNFRLDGIANYRTDSSGRHDPRWIFLPAHLAAELTPLSLFTLCSLFDDSLHLHANAPLEICDASNKVSVEGFGSGLSARYLDQCPEVPGVWWVLSTRLRIERRTSPLQCGCETSGWTAGVSRSGMRRRRSGGRANRGA